MKTRFSVNFSRSGHYTVTLRQEKRGVIAKSVKLQKHDVAGVKEAMLENKQHHCGITYFGGGVK